MKKAKSHPEENFRKKLIKKLSKILKSISKSNCYIIEKEQPLIYKTIVNEDLSLTPNKVENLKRGIKDFAFNADLVIYKLTKNNKKLPLIAIETKYRGFSTHDVLTYSSKSLKHKEFYPHLRYGFVIGGENIIVKKFFVHNLGLDFAVAMKNLNNKSLNELKKVLKEQIKTSEFLLNVFADKKKIKIFNLISKIKYEN